MKARLGLDSSSWKVEGSQRVFKLTWLLRLSQVLSAIVSSRSMDSGVESLPSLPDEARE